MLKKFLKILAYVMAITVLLLVMAWGSIFVFSGPIKRSVTQRISNQLTAPVRIADIKLSVFSNFPLISVSFNQINASEAHAITGKPLMQLERFTITLNPINLLRGKYKFESIILQNGSITAARNADSTNYDLFKKTGGGAGQTFSLDFKKVTLEKIRVTFLDLEQGDTLALLVNKIQLSGSFNEQQYLLNTTGNIVPMIVNMGGNAIKLTRPVSFKTAFTVNRADTSYSFSNTALTIENLDFIVNGKITGGDQSYCNLQLQGKELGLQRLLQLIPAKYLEGISDYESEGVLECKAQVNGKIGKGKVPDIQVDFSITDGVLGKKGIDAQLKNLQLTGKLEYYKKNDITFSSLKLPRIEAEVNGQKVHARLTVDNFKDPYITAAAQGTFNLQQWQKLFKFKVIENVEGLLTINLEAEGKTSGFKKATEGIPALFKGTVQAQNVRLALKDNPNTFESINARLYADNNLLRIDTLEGRINGNALQINGRAHHLLDYLFSNNTVLEVEGRLNSPHIDIPSLTGTNRDETAKPAAAKPAQPAAKTGFSIPANINFRLASRIGRITFNKFNAANITGTIDINKGVITLQNLDFEAMKGRFSLTGNVFAQTAERFVISATLDAKGVDINQLFYQCNNFGQKEITNEHLYGTLTAHLQLAAPMDKHLNILIDKLFVSSELKITGGRLRNYKPLQSLSRFINVSELEDISFDELQNTIEIKDRKITIPRFEIRNSALNLVAEGSHTFDNYMEYRFRVKLNEVLTKKFSRRKATTDNYQEEDDGINLFILMSGTPDNLKVQYDKKSAIKKAGENIKKEKNTLSELLRKEFNIQKKEKDKEASPKENTDRNNEGISEWETDIPQ